MARAVDRFEREEQAEENRFNVEPIPTDTMAEPLDSTKPRRPPSRVAPAAPAAARVPRKATPKKPPKRPTKRSKNRPDHSPPARTRSDALGLGPLSCLIEGLLSEFSLDGNDQVFNIAVKRHSICFSDHQR